MDLENDTGQSESKEMSEEELAAMDELFLAQLATSAAQQSQTASYEQASFWLSVAILAILVVGLCLTCYWFVRGRMIRKRRKLQGSPYTKILPFREVAI